MKRRVFIEKSGKTALMASLGVLAACANDTEDIQPVLSDEGIEIDLSASPFDQLETPGNWVLHPTENILLVNDSGTLRAFTSVCTHSGCARNWTFQSDARCTCHGSEFNKEGQVVRGPANRNLQSYDVVLDGDSAVVT